LDVFTSHSGHELKHTDNALSRPSGWHPILHETLPAEMVVPAAFAGAPMSAMPSSRVKVDAKPVRLQ
jgi:hypothetical protein